MIENVSASLRGLAQPQAGRLTFWYLDVAFSDIGASICAHTECAQ
jgi:hypothetical protein